MDPIGIIEELVQSFKSNFDTIIFLVASTAARGDSPLKYKDFLLLRLFHAAFITPSNHATSPPSAPSWTSGYSASLPLTPLLLHILMGAVLLLF